MPCRHAQAPGRQSGARDVADATLADDLPAQVEMRAMLALAGRTSVLDDLVPDNLDRLRER
jgi:hypothetical protein